MAQFQLKIVFVGMGADLFGSFAEASCAALVVAADSDSGECRAPILAQKNFPSVVHPLT